MGDWGQAAKHLATKFGFSASTAKRWTRAAAGMEEEVLTLLGTEEYERIRGTAVWDNDFLIGHGVKVKHRLETPFAKVAL